MKQIIAFILTSILLTGCSQFQNEVEQKSDMSTKQYASSASGLRFAYPADWLLNDLGGADGKTPHLFIDEAYDINTMNTVCGELGGCQRDAKKLQQSIEDGVAPGIISFQGGKGSLNVTCSSNEGYDLIPSPMYEFTFYRGDKVYRMKLNDLSHRLSNGEICSQSSYIMKIKAPDAINQADYRPYDDFVLAIRNTLVLE